MQRYTTNPRVIATDLGNELILLDPETEQMYSLNETGRAIWHALPLSDPDDAVRALTGAFDVTPDAAAVDVRLLLSALVDAGLVHCAG